MRTVVNLTDSPYTTAWCTVASHYANTGLHIGLLGKKGCQVESHTIPPGAALTYDETAKNGPFLASLLAPLEVV